jgi:hypothetical protein
MGDRWSLLQTLELAAAIMSAGHHAEGSARLYGAIDALREAISCPLGACDRSDHDRSLAAVRSSLGEAAFARAWAEGRGMPLVHVIAEATTALVAIAAAQGEIS